LDVTRYSGGTNTAPCQDIETGTPPSDFTTIGDLKLPPGTSADAVIATAGDTWKSWGWYVIERDGFYKPNRFGYGPDGYRMQIMAAPQPGYPPSPQGISPCFPGNLANDRGPFPTVLQADWSRARRTSVFELRDCGPAGARLDRHVPRRHSGGPTSISTPALPTGLSPTGGTRAHTCSASVVGVGVRTPSGADRGVFSRVRAAGAHYDDAWPGGTGPASQEWAAISGPAWGRRC